MLNREEFEIQKEIVDWLQQNGMTFHNAMILASYAQKTDISIAEAYIDLHHKFTVRPSE